MDDLHAMVFEAAGWGWLGLVASERGLRLLVLPRTTQDEVLGLIQSHYPGVPDTADDELLVEAAKQIRAYLAGGLREFSVPLDLRGHTSFALSVWAAAARIAYGQTRTYLWIAGEVGQGEGKGIYQAVGAALGSNPVPLIVPCHRVIGSDGSLHGYAGGLEMKARLLAMESGQGAFPLS